MLIPSACAHVIRVIGGGQAVAPYRIVHAA
jgi:hypothetical protein